MILSLNILMQVTKYDYFLGNTFEREIVYVYIYIQLFLKHSNLQHQCFHIRHNASR